jgi:Tol biopolymer transport system component
MKKRKDPMKSKLPIFLILCLVLTACNNVGFQVNIVPPENTPTPQASGTTAITPQATSTPPAETPTVSPAPTRVASPTPSPTTLGGASALLFSSNRGGDYQDLYLQAFGTNALTRLTRGESNTFAGPFSPDGKKIVFTGFGLTESYVGVMNADGSDPLDLTDLADVSDGFPAWSPDGSQIAFTSRRDGNNEIYLMDPYGHNLKRLTFNPTDDFAPAWSPDGKQLAFLSDRDAQTGVYSIYIMNAAASWVKRLTNDGGNDYTPAWSPDGSTIVFRSDHNGQADLYSVSVDGTNLTNLTNTPKSNEWSPSWSPDGTLIAFQTDRDGNWEIYTMQANGADPVNFTNNPADDEMPYWKKAE